MASCQAGHAAKLGGRVGDMADAGQVRESARIPVQVLDEGCVFEADGEGLFQRLRDLDGIQAHGSPRLNLSPGLCAQARPDSQQQEEGYVLCKR
jgi:hypothetical protein